MLELVVHAALQQLPGGEGQGQGAKAASRTAVGGGRAGTFGWLGYKGRWRHGAARCKPWMP